MGNTYVDNYPEHHPHCYIREGHLCSCGAVKREPDLGEICNSMDIDNCAMHGIGTPWREKWDKEHPRG